MKTYLETRLPEVEKANQTVDARLIPINGRQLTNAGTFRAYLFAYLNSHPEVNTDLTVLVRQLQPTEAGLPIQIYCYLHNKDWIEFEQIQSDLFDHILSVASEFDLTIFQNPSGLDWRKAV